MSTSTERSVVHIVCMMLMIILTLTPTIASEESSSSSSSSSSSPLSNSLEDWKQGGGGFYQLENVVEEDYGIWNPAPGYSGGNAAPIPHAENSLLPEDLSFSRTSPFP
ncbi:hypothetical protein Ddye_007181 [Dipteronia dyeriana]|uniref:Uncharacterized protein n=1 Tax=Dipteronia dyeriana TaxID=168575 RepID=A0AAD9XJV1_9ROSI|nr:hypothetical protein Ddye_007181 [Dipteronia dyeriana]